jgi:diaminopimelate decarboxylase
MTMPPTGFHRIAGVQYVDQVDVESIVRRWPTPVIVYSAATLRENAAAVLAAFPADTIVQYSYKACYLPPVLRLLHACGLDAEVCSRREYRLAVGVGLATHRITWNAVTLDEADLALAVTSGIRWLGLNTLEDIMRVDAAAGSAGRRVRVALRVHPAGIKSSYLKPGTRLGLDVADGTAAKAVDLVLDSDNLEFVGVHSHTQVQRITPDDHTRCLRSLLGFAATTFRATGYRMRQVGLGGGLACRAEMRRRGTDVTDFGVALARVRDEIYPETTIVLEPGRFFVSDAAIGLTTVLSRTAAQGRQWILVDLGTQVLVPFEGRQFTLRVARCTYGDTETVSVGDRLSSYGGVISTDLQLPRVSQGALLVVEEIGAYTTSVAQQFMFGMPTVVMVDGVHTQLVAAAETDEDWVRGLLGASDE